MEEKMKNYILTAGCAVLALGFAAPAEAREQKDLIGYTVSEQVINDRDAEFRKADTSGDGAINFKEFQAAAMLENEYEMFDMNDANNDQLLTIEEFRTFSKMGPARVSNGPSMTSYNFNQKPSDK
jgi:Ca2+-binding EF-hand superfamily protein